MNEMKAHFLAYKDKDGKGFGELPFIFADVTDEQDTEKERARLVNEGYKDVTIFTVNGEDLPEEIDWEFVNAHQVHLRVAKVERDIGHGVFKLDISPNTWTWNSDGYDRETLMNNITGEEVVIYAINRDENENAVSFLIGTEENNS